MITTTTTTTTTTTKITKESMGEIFIKYSSIEAIGTELIITVRTCFTIVSFVASSTGAVVGVDQISTVCAVVTWIWTHTIVDI